MISSTCGIGQGPPQKLSKPLTNRSSSNLLPSTKQALEPASPLPSADADSPDGYFPKMTPKNGERRPRRNTRSKIRSYLYGQDQEISQPRSSEDEGSSPKRLATVARDVKRRLSRTDTSNLLESSSLGASTASSAFPSFVADATGLALDEAEVVKEQIKEKVWTDARAAQNHVSSPIDEDKHPDSVLTPIRRRSLYTPGIATRSPEDILRKPPPPSTARTQAEREYYYNPSLSETSPLPRLANLRASNTGRSTPAELDYTHLGAMKLGTLRVTNGAASPVPREQDASPAPASSLDTASQEDYYTASEGDRSEGAPSASWRPESGHLSRTTPKDSLDVVTVPTEFASALAYCPTFPESTVRNHTPPPRRGSYGHCGFDNSEPKTDHNTTTTCKPIRRKPLPASAIRGEHDQAGSTAMEYAVRFPINRHLHASEAHVAQEETIDLQPQEDTASSRTFAPPRANGPNPDVWRAFVHAAEQQHAANGSREDAFLKLTGTSRPQDECDSLNGMPQTRQIGPPQSKDSCHMDSGYSSYTSLESIEPVSMPCKSSPRHGRSQSAYPSEAASQTKTTRKSYYGTENHDPSEASTATCPPSPGSAENHAIDIAQERLFLHSEKKPLRPDLPQEQLSGPKKSRKLQKRRPRSQPPLQRISVSTGEGSARYEIPPVPTAIADLHSDRVMKFPLLDHTDSSLQHISSDGLLRSSESMANQTRFPSPVHGSEDPSAKDKPSLFQKLATRARSRSRSRPRERQPLYQSDEESIRSEICRSPSWSDYGNKKKKEQKKKDKAERELQKKLRRESSAERNSNSRSRSRFRSRSRRRSSQPEPNHTLTDFGTVKESLGAGPYDIARSCLALGHDTTGQGIQPHQISTAKPSMLRGESVLTNDGGNSRQRTRSLAGHAGALNGGMETLDIVPSKPSRPYTMFIDRPAVPALPVADLKASGRASDCGMSTGADVQSIVNGHEAGPATSISVAKPRDNVQHSRPTNGGSCYPDSASSAKNTALMEVLIDKLLDAPDAESKENILQQLRQRRRGRAVEPRGTCQPTNDVLPGTSKIAAVLDQAVPSESHSPSIPKTVSPEKPRITRLKAVDHDRPQSTFADVPPIPPLPSAEHLQQQESRRSIAEIERNRTALPPQTCALKPAKKDLWSGCAMEMEHKKANKPGTDWESHRQAWSQRRRSAGEALLSKDQPPELPDDAPKAKHSDFKEDPAPQPAICRAKTAGSEGVCLPQRDSKAFHKPWAPRHDQRIPQSLSTGSLQANSTVTAQAQAFQRLTGRFEGGLMYGYEPGFGLGGSAGTRSTKTGATRKSVHISQGYGVDLSDVPIFVAPSK
ncbi:MAG: hypothetical protein LQ338_000176 [Usnochroma carphineum]|nr:MAG: hypothetical protein LQ338_000176 [Usnochroma carphineum]